jgi:hypothetical protein
VWSLDKTFLLNDGRFTFSSCNHNAYINLTPSYKKNVERLKIKSDEIKARQGCDYRERLRGITPRSQYMRTAINKPIPVPAATLTAPPVDIIGIGVEEEVII